MGLNEATVIECILSGFLTGTLLSVAPLLITLLGALALLATVGVPLFHLLLKILGRRCARWPPSCVRPMPGRWPSPRKTSACCRRSNGAGKSTLVHLLMRIHEPDAGRIRIDGADIATVTLHSLRRQIGVVPQHVLLFNGTMWVNIAYGRPDPEHGAIEAAARAHDFITRLPQG